MNTQKAESPVLEKPETFAFAENTSDTSGQECVGFFPTPSNSVTQAGYPTVYLTYETVYLEIVSDPTG